MSAKFSMDDYVDVAERIRNFAERYPEGSLQSELTAVAGGWMCKAYAYRTPGDERPGIGHAYEAVPGKTPYTKDSEAMNAETSAWGRAIVALGFDTKKIASAQEVKARQSAPVPSGVGGAVEPQSQPAPAPNSSTTGADGVGAQTAQAAGAPAPSPFSPPDGAVPSGSQDERNAAAAGRVTVGFGKNKGKTLAELGSKQVGWYASVWEPDTSKFAVSPIDRQLRQAARLLAGVEPMVETDGPFGPAPAVDNPDDPDVPF